MFFYCGYWLIIKSKRVIDILRQLTILENVSDSLKQTAKEAIKLIKNSSTISSFCNDVIGDICGIVSGSMGAIIAITLSDKISPDYKALVALVVASVISSLTVGFKAIGKKYAIKKSDDIIFIVAKTISKFTKEK